jgi:hypothetical protein
LRFLGPYIIAMFVIIYRNTELAGFWRRRSEDDRSTCNPHRLLLLQISI